MVVAIVAGDAGGARALLPIIEVLAKAGHELRLSAYAAAAIVWTEAGLAPDRPNGKLTDCDRLVCGTSYQADAWELRMIESARLAGVPSVSLLDSWSNYRERFLLEGRLILPDRIAVMDELAVREMVKEGFDPERLLVTGLPVFDELGSWRTRGVGGASHSKTVASLGHRETIVLFASQPLSEMPGAASWGFHERGVWKDVFCALETILLKRNQRGTMLLKRHPREKGSLPEPWGSSDHLNVLEADKSLHYRDWILLSDLVVGMNSNLLLEACYLSCPVISYQPDLGRPDPLPSNRNGWSRLVTERDQLSRAIEEELFDPQIRQVRRSVLNSIVTPGGATENVIKWIMQ